MVVILKSNKTAEQIIRRNLQFLAKHPNLIIRRGDQIPDPGPLNQELFGFKQ